MAEEPVEIECIPPVQKTRWWPSIVAFIMSLLVAPGFMCLCGHLRREALPVTVAAAGFAFYGWLSTRATYPWRLIHIAAVVISVLMLGKNVGDVLWYGHNPVF